VGGHAYVPIGREGSDSFVSQGLKHTARRGFLTEFEWMIRKQKQRPRRELFVSRCEQEYMFPYFFLMSTEEQCLHDTGFWKRFESASPCCKKHCNLCRRPSNSYCAEFPSSQLQTLRMPVPTRRVFKDRTEPTMTISASKRRSAHSTRPIHSLQI
jgi:hypothetical protein